MVNGPSPGPAPSRPGPGQQLPADPVQLPRVAPPEAAQEGSQSLPSRKRGVDGTLTVPPRVQAVPPVRNTSASSMQSPPARPCPRESGGQTPPGSSSCRPCSPGPGHCPGRGVLDEFTQTQVLGEGHRKDQPSISHQAVVVEGDLDSVGMVKWQHLLGAPCFGSVWSFQNHYPRSTGALS